MSDNKRKLSHISLSQENTFLFESELNRALFKSYDNMLCPKKYNF